MYYLAALESTLPTQHYLGNTTVAQANRFGIPVGSSRPSMYWILSLDRQSFRPRIDELILLQNYRDYLISYYGGPTLAKLKAMQLPSCAGHNTTTFKKADLNDWRYRKFSWTIGPAYMPSAYEEGFQPLSLVVLLDRIQKIGDRFTNNWIAWKNRYSQLYKIKDQPAA